MDNLELLNVEFGDCTVLRSKSAILMVDCGSMNQKIRKPETDISDVYGFITKRYSDMSDRQFMLTHYHRDHLHGLLSILSDDPRYFTRVYIPFLPLDRHGNSPLLEFAVFAYFFLPPQSDCSQVNTSCLRIFSRLRDTVGCDRVFTLKKDSVFMFDDVKYRVLSPSGSDFDFSDIFLDTVENLNIAMSNPFYTGKEKEFMRLKSQFIDRYYSCLEAFSLQSTVSSERRVHLTHLLDESLESMESLRQDMTLSPASPDIISILDNPLFRKSYSEAANAASIVFHNIREKSASYDDILMTGDVNDDIISGISGELYDSYYIVKAPHHGTQSGFSSVFKDLGISHILISNGEYHAGGEISQDYIDLKCIKHCTGNLSCKWFKASGGCCNRLLNCYDQPKGANMALKCPATQYYGEVPACMIYTVSPDGCHGCFCDNNVNF